MSPRARYATHTSPHLLSDGPLAILPSATVLHYAQAIFEGLKAYRHPTGTVTMFRPHMNMNRMNNSAQRLVLPASSLPSAPASRILIIPPQTFDGDAFLECIRRLVALERQWIPNLPGHSLYIRPTMSAYRPCPTWSVDLIFLVGTNGTLGVQPPTEALLFVILSPAGPYYPQGFKPVPLQGTTEYIRAAPGGRSPSPIRDHHLFADLVSTTQAPELSNWPQTMHRASSPRRWLHSKATLRICGYTDPSII